MKTIAIIVGTVPEAVKLGPVCRELRKHDGAFRAHVTCSGQHVDRVASILQLFGVPVDESLCGAITRENLSCMTASLLQHLVQWLRELRPDLVVVQGDTATALAGALAAFYEGCAVAHVESGLTTGNVAHPFPEELHREVIGKVATLLFAPSERAAEHARRVARPGARVFCTGNPCVDAMERVMGRAHEGAPLTPTLSPKGRGSEIRKKILVTVHRRENHGTRGEQIGTAIARLAATRSDAEVVYVGHTHPALAPLTDRLRLSNNITVLPPQGYMEWLGLLKGCYFVLSDSGGAQEEAPWLGKPVLVLRDETERPEVVELGAATLVGSDPELIYETAVALLDDDRAYRRMQIPRSWYPYGHGDAAEKIVRHIVAWMRDEGPREIRNSKLEIRNKPKCSKLETRKTVTGVPSSEFRAFTI
jgi:UDP-N-acetylglucosamine 2-epimerase (non-hydrolysing)